MVFSSQLLIVWVELERRQQQPWNSGTDSDSRGKRASEEPQITARGRDRGQRGCTEWVEVMKHCESRQKSVRAGEVA